jgi:putative transposase
MAGFPKIAEGIIVQMHSRQSALELIKDELLSNLDGLCERILALAGGLPGYEDVPRSVLRPGAEFAIRELVATIFIEENTPTALEHLAAAGAVGRSELGVPIDSILEAFPRALTEIWHAALESAERVGVDASVLLELTPRLLDWQNALTVGTRTGAQRIRDEVDQLDRERRGQLLQSLFYGSGAEAHRDELIGAGFVPDGRYVAFRTRASRKEVLDAIERDTIDRCHREGICALTGPIGGDLAGVADEHGHLQTDVALIGVGPPTQLAGLQRSFRYATRAVEAGSAFGLIGVYSLDGLAVQSAIIHDDDVAHCLSERYLRPVGALGPFGELLLKTVHTYLRSGMRAESTARELIVHRNTLGYRLRKFEELTGADLNSMPDVVATWWALERWSIGRR